MTLDDRLSHIADLLIAKRATNWTLGDEFCAAVKAHGKGVVGQLATLARCSAEHIRQAIRVAVAFPDEHRHADIDWSWYREVYCAAKRGKREPLELLPECVREDEAHRYEASLSAAELRLLYKSADDKPPVLRFAATCEHCGTRNIAYPPAEAARHGLMEDGILCVMCSICGHYLGTLDVGEPRKVE